MFPLFSVRKSDFPGKKLLDRVSDRAVGRSGGKMHAVERRDRGVAVARDKGEVGALQQLEVVRSVPGADQPVAAESSRTLRPLAMQKRPPASMKRLIPARLASGTVPSGAESVWS